MLRVHTAMANIPGARMVDDVATRFEVPIGTNTQGGVTSVADIFAILSMEKGFPGFTVGKSTLETAFIKIINEDVASNAHHEEVPTARRFWGLC
jgi:ATP-binding cassette subfamily A (ABC1) protein 3